MIKKLRIKFVIVSMLSLLLVLTVIMGAVYFLNYKHMVDEADGLLSILLDNDGVFPKPANDGRLQSGDAYVSQDPGQMENSGQNIRGNKGPARTMSPETPYSTRYFTVTLDSGSGEVLATDTGKIAAVDETDAADYGSQVWSLSRSRGFMDFYRYGLQENDGEVLIIFLDCHQNIDTFISFLVSGCLISLIGLGAVLLLLIFFSGRVVAPVAESYTRQKRFITDAGHEIKTPITIIDADAEVLAADIGDNEWLRDIQLQTRRLAALTQDLIYLSRMEEGPDAAAMIEFPFSDMVSETFQSFQALAITQKKDLNVRIQPMISVRGDEKALGQLVAILMDNALKYCPEGGVITASLAHTGKYARLTVTNTADNIDPEQLPHLFERFYRGDASRSSRGKVKGYGIGLAIARAVTAAHKGKIWASADDEKSLTITVVIPAEAKGRDVRSR